MLKGVHVRVNDSRDICKDSLDLGLLGLIDSWGTQKLEGGLYQIRWCGRIIW